MKKASSILLAITALASFGTASAATVTFTTGNFSKTGSDYSLLNNTGTVLQAVSFTTAAGRTGPFSSTNPDPAATLNGITFTSTTYAANLSGTYYTTNSANIDVARPSGTDYATATQLYGLAYDVLITGTNDTNLTVNLKNLVQGNTYMVQFLFSSDSAARKVSVAAGTFTSSVAWNTQGTGSDGTSTVLNYGTGSGVGIVTATFTADSTTELFTMLSNTTFSGEGNSRISLAGMVVTQVPEPSAAIMAAGALALVGLRRRRH